MFNNFLNWRKENDVDNILLNYTFPNYDEMKKIYLHGYHNIDKLGRPIYIECTGKLKIDTLFSMSPEADLVKHYI